MILGIIPARYASTRFPAKALADIGGKPMIQLVYEQCQKAKSLAKVVVATDHPAIYEVVEGFGGVAVMTKEEHPSGTDRCAEALGKTEGAFDYAINIQGDEPFIQPEQIDLLAEVLQQGNGQVDIATLMHPIGNLEELKSPDIVKVVAGQGGTALYFSRQAVPFLRGVAIEDWLNQHTFYRHIGIYAFKSEVLKKLTKLSLAPLEDCEKLEQLRWLEAGYRIHIAETPYQSIGIDTPEDLKRVMRGK